MFRLECWGPYACFTRPEMKAERVSYDMMTPSAARGVVETLYWHPNVQYIIDQIDVLSPIEMMNLRRNELKSKLHGKDAVNEAKKGHAVFTDASIDRTQRAAVVLTNVHYCIHYHFLLKENDTQALRDKVTGIITKRGKNGKCFTQPYLGCREFSAHFKLLKPEEPIIPIKENRDLGYMLYDLDYSGEAHNTPMFFRAVLKDGVLNLRGVEVFR